MSDPSGADDRQTRVLGGATSAPAVRRFTLTVEEGPAAGARFTSASDRAAIGAHPSNDLAVADDTVSGFHCEIHIDAGGARLRDVGSLNGTTVDGVRVADAWLRSGSRIRMGRTLLAFALGTEVNPLPRSERTELGSLVGRSAAMRTAFALMERAAASTATVLLEGETGTGKEGAARAIHDLGARRDQPFVVIDCGAIPANLLESELFGHERGAFTGAALARAGAFEEADRGTVFLDELGELPLELQPKLLRVLEQRQVRRIGSNTYQPVDVRVIAATHRDLRASVNRSEFRADLYYRLAVVRVTLPPLRERPDDIPILVDRLLERLTDDPELRAPLLAPEVIARLQRTAWVGNVRELRNYLERCLVLGGPVPLGEEEVERGAPGAPDPLDAGLPYAAARQRALDAFERGFLQALLVRHGGSPTAAARAAGMNRAYLYRLLQRHGLRGVGPD